MNVSEMAERMFEAMIQADRKAAADVTEQAIAEGISPDRVITDLLDAALIRIGKSWETEMASVAHTFVAAKIAEDILLRCLSDPNRPATRSGKGRVVIGNIEDDFHSLGRKIVVAFLQAAGWEVHDLGNDVTPDRFVERALEVDSTIVGASAMTQTTALNIRKLRSLIDERGLGKRIKLAVGGAVFNWRPELVAEVGGDGTARSAAAADALCTRLQTEVLAAGQEAAGQTSSKEGGAAS